MQQSTNNLPRFLFEDCLGLLRGLVILAWIGVAVGVAIEIWIRFFSQHEWPRLGGFSFTYNAILLEFSLNTVVLTALLTQRDWYERVPRESAHRLRWLLFAVLVWEGLHLFGVFHVTGSVRGPLLPLLPVLLAAALFALPGRAGCWLAAYLLAGHLLVVFLEGSGKIHPHGLLAGAFAMTAPVAGLGLLSLAAVMIAAVALGLMTRRWVYPDPHALTPSRRLDPTTGLFTRAFLEKRIQAELGRTRRQGGEVGLLLLALEGQQAEMLGEADMRNLAQCLISMLRLDSDTPARYGPGVLAVLLPAPGGAEGLGQIVQRLSGELSGPGLAPHLRAAAVVTKGFGVDAPALMRSADDALQRARTGGQAVIVPLGDAG